MPQTASILLFVFLSATAFAAMQFVASRVENADGLRLFELVPDAACPANALYLGGHPATPNWNRHWRGSVAEAIFLSPSVSAFDAATVAAHLAFKWQLPRTAPPPSNTPFVLRSLGIAGDNLYRTLFIFR